MCEVSPALLGNDVIPKVSQFYSFLYFYDLMPELRRSDRIARRAGCLVQNQGARPLGSSQPRVEKSATDSTNTTGFVKTCKDIRCKTCPNLVTSATVTSNVSNRTYQCINSENSKVSCKSNNLIYLLTCNICSQQYVGETAPKFNKRMNGHRTSVFGCEHVVNHKKKCNGFDFSIQVLEKLVGTGYIDEETMDPEITKLRKTREDFWIKRLRTLYPYGLNEKAFDKVSDSSDHSISVGHLFPPLDRNRERPIRSRTRNKKAEITSSAAFFKVIDENFDKDLKKLFNNIRIILNGLSKSLLRQIASEVLEPEIFATDSKKEQCYLYILDIIDTKFADKIINSNPVRRTAPKNVCVVHFVNKGMDDLHLSSIFKSKDVVNLLPEKLREDEHIPVVTFHLDPPIRNKILNYKKTVTEIEIIKQNNSFIANNLPTCECSTSLFKDPVHNHVVTGDLRIITNPKLRKLISKGPNFRENKFISYDRCLSSVEVAVDSLIENLMGKYNLPGENFDAWRNEIVNIVRRKVNHFKFWKVSQPVKQVLRDPDVSNYLTDLHSKFVLVPIDKASNNVAIICKRFYIEKLLSEVGLLGNPNNTYQISEINPNKIIDTNIHFCKSLSLSVNDKMKCLPFMYWSPKMHYQPCRARFIVASAACSTKPISNLVSIIFKKVFEQVQNFHSKTHFYKNYKRFWVIQNSKTLLQKLEQINLKKGAKDISTFDFSTLYTKLPHHDLIKVLQEIVEFVFNGGRKTADGNRKYLTVLGKTCFFSRTKRKGNSYTLSQIKMMVHHLISETYFTVGNVLFRQSIGIPMGIDPAPFWANLYLYHYENIFITKLIRTDRYRGFKFKNCFRFIDDACNLNDDGEFERSYREIYPSELELKCEHKGEHATFLEIDITIKDNIFVYKLFDKRDNFPFFIVRMPDLNGNIPSHVFYGSFLSEILRIARATLLYQDFVSKSRELIDRMLNQGASAPLLLRQINKVIFNHPEAFQSFNRTINEFRKDLS